MAMAMLHNSIFSPNLPPQIPFSFPQFRNKRFQPPKAASIPFPPINIDYLETEFSGHGVSFSSLGHSCLLRMGLDNGSLATLMLPTGLITSYKASMWHGGLLELLHTSVSEAEGGGGAAVIRGGVSLAFTFEGDDENRGFSWSPASWGLRDVRGSPHESIQVELISSNPEEKVEVKYIVTLQEDGMSSEVVITNLTSSPLRLMGSVMGHLAVSTPEATYAVGLERANYFVRPPLLSNFSIIPPDTNRKDSGSKDSWGPMAFTKRLSSWGLRNQNENGVDEESTKNGVEMEGEEEDNYKHLTEKRSLIYTDSPRSFTVMDRGKRNSVVVGREGFGELYIFSPGSSHKPYGKYSFVCVGQASLLKPLTLAPKAEWRGAQYLRNPNL